MRSAADLLAELEAEIASARWCTACHRVRTGSNHRLCSFCKKEESERAIALLACPTCESPPQSQCHPLGKLQPCNTHKSRLEALRAMRPWSLNKEVARA